MMIQLIKRTLLVGVLCGMTTFAFADDAAPVYDADSMPPQFDGQQGGAMPAPQSQPQPLAQSQSEQSSSEAAYSSSLSPKVDELQTEVQGLRGQVETLNHQLQQVQSQVKSMYTDLDKRVSKQQQSLKAQTVIAKAPSDDHVKSDDAGSVPTPKSLYQPRAPKNSDKTADTASAKSNEKTDDTTAKSSEVDPNVIEEQHTYQVAYDLIKGKKYDEAIAALQKMLLKYPSGQFAANAHYWLGELYTLTSKNDEASAEFSTVVRDFSDSPKVADAQLKLGLMYVSQSRWPEAKSSFKKVVSRYPGSASAHLAAEQLKQIKQTGH